MHDWPLLSLRGATRVTCHGAAASCGRGVGWREDCAPRLSISHTILPSVVTVGPTPSRALARTLTALRTDPSIGRPRRFYVLGLLPAPGLCSLGPCPGGTREFLGDSGRFALCPWRPSRAPGMGCLGFALCDGSPPSLLGRSARAPGGLPLCGSFFLPPSGGMRWRWTLVASAA